MINLVLTILVVVYGYLAVKEVHNKTVPLLYAACLVHVSIVGWLISDLSWTEPILGLSTVSWLIVVGCIMIMKTPKFKTILSPVLGCVSLLVTLALLSPKPTSNAHDIQIWVWMHLLLILVGYVGCIIAGVFGGVYIYVQSKLKQKELKDIRRYPALKSLSEYNLLSTWLGAIGLFSGIVSGLTWALHVDKFVLDYTWLASFGLLGCYTVGLGGKLLGRRDRWTAWVSVIGLCSLGVYFFLSSLIGTWHIGGI